MYCHRREPESQRACAGHGEATSGILWTPWLAWGYDIDTELIIVPSGLISTCPMYRRGPYAKKFKDVEKDIKDLQARINEKLAKSCQLLLTILHCANMSLSVKESDSVLDSPNLWDLASDRERMGEVQSLQVTPCTKIILTDHKLAEAAMFVNAVSAL